MNILLNRGQFLAAVSSFSGFLLPPNFCALDAVVPSDVDDPFGIVGWTGKWNIIYRPDDLAWLGIRFKNLRVVDTFSSYFHEPPRLVKIEPNDYAYIAVALPPQHLAEESYSQYVPQPSAASPAHARLSGGSRIVFRVPKEAANSPSQGLPYDFGALMAACSLLQLSVPPFFNASAAPNTPPSLIETAIEFPFRLMLAPNSGTNVTLPGIPKRVGHWTIAWKAELTALSNGSASPSGGKLFAPYAAFGPQAAGGCPLAPTGQDGDPETYNGKDGMRTQDRASIAYYTGSTTNGAPPPTSIDVGRLALTSAGAIADLHWSRPIAPSGDRGDLAAWTHRAMLGRDDLVELVYPGTVYPYGHRCRYVIQIYRTVVNGIALLREREFLRFVERDVVYTDPTDQAHFATKRISILDKQSPDLAPIDDIIAQGTDCVGPQHLAFVPKLQAQSGPKFDFRATIERQDLGDNVVHSRESIIFVSDAVAQLGTSAQQSIAKEYQSAVVPDSNSSEFMSARSSTASIGDIAYENGQFWIYTAARGATPIWQTTTIQRNFALLRNVAYQLALPDVKFPNLANEATLPVQYFEVQGFIDFANQIKDQVLDEVRPVRHYPFVPGARILVDSARQILGREIDAEISRLSLSPVVAPIDFQTALANYKFLAQEAQNPTAVFATLVEPFALDLQDQTDVLEARAKSALVDLAPSIVGLSGARGVLTGYVQDVAGAGPAAAAAATAAAQAQIAQLLNAPPKQVIQSLVDNLFKNDPKILGVVSLKDLLKAALDKIVAEADVTSPAIPRLTKPSASGSANYHFEADINPDEGVVQSAQQYGGDDSQPHFVLDVTITASTEGPPTSQLTCTITNFAVQILEMIVVPFRKVTFSQTGTNSPNISVDALAPAFGPPLDLLNSPILKELLEEFGEARSLLADGVYLQTVGFQLPEFSLGALDVLGLALDFNVALPITSGKAFSITFSLGSAANPFIIAVDLFGGGGYIGMTINPSALGNNYDSSAPFSTIQGALEFGGYFDLDIGIANGGAYLAAGFAFQISSDGSFGLTAYVRAGGYLSILGIVSASIEFYAALSSDPPDQGGGYTGSAEITYEISILFFSATVSLHFSKHFGGGGDAAHPQQLASNAQSIAFEHWENHRNAYA